MMGSDAGVLRLVARVMCSSPAALEIVALCRYYNDRGFTAMGTAMPLRHYTCRLFEREIKDF